MTGTGRRTNYAVDNPSQATRRAHLRAAAKAHPGIRVLIGSASQDLFYVWLAKMSADTLYFQQLGVRFVRPRSTPRASSRI